MRNGRSGAEGSRTLDLLNAIQALSQLSYGPTGGKTGGGVSIPRPSRVGQRDAASRDAASLPEVAARVDRRAVDAHLVVKVRPGGAARRADGADRLAAMHLLALAHVERGEMAVERVEPTAVIDDHDAAVARVAPGEDHLAVAGRRHRKAVLRRDVDAGVHLAPLAVGGRADAEGRGDEPAHGPERRHAAAHLLAAVRVRSPATWSRSAALRCSACHTCLAAAAPMTTTSAAARREPCAAREMTRASGMKDLLEVGCYPATRPLCWLSIPGCGRWARRRSCSACSRTSCVRRSPPSMRASSATRSVGASGRAVETVRSFSTFLVTTTWCSAKAAISGRWVIQRTWRLRPSWRSLRPTTSATAPPMPASTSSKMSVAPLSSAAARVLSASMMRDSSPPEATRASERGSSPGLVERKNSTSSQPSGPSARPSDS